MLKSALRGLSGLTPGFLAFLGYYEILSGFSLALHFTVDRVTYVYRFQSPLLGGLELDLLAYAILASYFAYVEDERRDKIIHLFLVIASISILSLSRPMGSTSLAYIALGMASLLSSLYYVRHKGFSRLIPGILVSIVFLEMAALVSVASYYVVGNWVPILFHIVMRERLIWAPLEWVSVLLLIVVMWSSFSRIFLGRPLFKPLKIGVKGTSIEGIGSRILLLLALSLTVILIVLPHLPTVNPEFQPVSVDTLSYESFFEGAEGGGLSQALGKLSGRPIYLFFLYYAWLALSRNTVLLMDLIHPLASLTLIAAASFYAGRRLHGRSRAGYAAILVPLGYVLPAFVAGGFQANSLALAPAILALSVNPKSRTGLAKLSLLLTLTALIHPWTHLMYAAAVIAYSFKDRRRLVSSLSAAALSYVVSNVIDYYLVSTHVSADAVRAVSGSFGFYLVGSWFDAVNFWGWNTLSNPLFISASVSALEGWAASVMCIAVPLTLILPAGLAYRLILNIPLQLQVSKKFEDFPVKYHALMFLVLLVRVLGNLSGLTPLEASILPQ